MPPAGPDGAVSSGRGTRAGGRDVLIGMGEDWGVYRTAELLRMGESTASIRVAARNGDLLDLRPCWWAIGSANETVAMAVKAGGVLSCVSALRLRGIWVAPGYHGVHVRLSRHGEDSGKRRCAPFGRQIPTRRAVDDVETALACAARCMSEEDWVAAVDSALNKKLTSMNVLRRRWGRYRDRSSSCWPNAMVGNRVDRSATPARARIQRRCAGVDRGSRTGGSRRRAVGHRM